MVSTTRSTPRSTRPRSIRSSARRTAGRGIGDVVAYIANINSYAGSIGTTTIQYPNDGNTTGMFKLYNPNTNAGLSVNLAEVTDGTSNTIAFGEGLVGDNGKITYRGNGMAGLRTTLLSKRYTTPKRTPPRSTQALQSCNTFWNSGTLTGDTTGLKQYTGQVWAQGERGWTLFNTIVPPNSKHYPWHSCRLGGCLECARKGPPSLTPAATTRVGRTSRLATGASNSSRTRSVCLIYESLGTRTGGEVISADTY